MRASKLIKQTRLTYPRLSYYRDNLTMSGASSLQSLLQSVNLGTAPHKANESTCRCGFHGRAHESSSGNFIDRDWIAQALYANRPKRLYFHIALGQANCVSSNENGAWGRQLFHASGQVCGPANRC